MYKLLLIIGAGSFVGGVLRYLVSRFVQDSVLSTFPYGTFLVNVLGCFLIGLLFGLSEKGDVLSNEWRIFLTIGFCGGFTTFSTFAGESFSMIRDGNYFYVALYTGLSVFVGLLATFAGHFTIKVL
jgi:CrcB protein